MTVAYCAKSVLAKVPITEECNQRGDAFVQFWLPAVNLEVTKGPYFWSRQQRCQQSDWKLRKGLTFVPRMARGRGSHGKSPSPSFQAAGPINTNFAVVSG